MRVAVATALMGLFVMTASAGVSIPDAGAESLQDVIVVFHEDVDNPAQSARALTNAHGGELGFVYQHAIKGFSATLPSRAVTAIQRSPQVAHVEVDQLARVASDTSSVPVPTGIDRINADQNANLDIDGTDDLRVNTVVAVIDTGIDFQHSDLNVNTANSVDCSGGSPFSGSCSTGAGDDDNGHGTHVAGTIGALDDGPNYSGEIYTDVHVVGVAPGVEQWAVKVLRSDGSGYISWIVAGIDYVTANAPANGGPIAVANMSLGCECSSSAMDQAISESVAAGVTYAVAAGNSAKDASTFSPANHPDVITVSALADFDGEAGALAGPTCRTDEDDTLANFSNFGSEVEVTAPGVCILSAWNDGGYNIISGTSMASPHAAGAAALLAASGVTSPSDIRSTLQSTGNTDDWTDEIDGTEEPRVDVANETVYNPAMTGTDSGDADSPPSVNITNPDDGSTVSGTISVTADASDDGSVSQVEFFVDGGSIGVDNDGSDGWSVSWDTNTVADGDHTVSAEATDDAAQTATDSVAVTVNNSVSYVVDLAGSSINNGPSWTAVVTITVTDSSGNPLEGIVVEGTWSNGASGSASCTTVSDGTCSVDKSGIHKRVSSVTFTVDTVEGTTDFGGDSSTTVSKP